MNSNVYTVKPSHKFILRIYIYIHITSLLLQVCIMDLKWKILCWRTNSPSLSIGKLSPANLEVKLMYYSDPSKSPWSIVRTNRVQTFKLPHVLIFLIIFDIFWHLENSICRICPFLKKISSHFRILHHFSGEKPRNHRRIGNQAKLLEDGRPRCRAWGSWWWTGTVSKSTKSFGPREGQGHQNEKKTHISHTLISLILGKP